MSGYDDDNDDAKRRPFISWNGARLFRDTTAMYPAGRRAERGSRTAAAGPRGTRSVSSCCVVDVRVLHVANYDGKLSRRR